MSMKNNNATSIVFVSLFVLIAIASIGFYISRPQSIASANNSIAPVSPANTMAVSAPAKIEPAALLTKTQNDITVQLVSAKITSDGVEISFCFTALDNGEWRPTPGHLFFGGYEVFPRELGFTPDDKVADGKNVGQRCAFVRYVVDDVSTITTPMKFSILSFYAPGREMYSPCQELEQRLNSNPKAQAYGIKMKCEENADRSTNVSMLEHNPSVSAEEAQRVLDVIDQAEVFGNWQFTITSLTK